MIQWYAGLITSLILTFMFALAIGYPWILKGETKHISPFKASLFLVIHFVVTTILTTIIITALISVRLRK